MSGSPPRRQQRQHETRRRLLDAAAATFTAKGYHGASVSEIVATAGYTTGALYANFDSKEHLFLELIDEHLDKQRSDVDALLREGDPAAFQQGLRARIEGLIRGLAQSGDVREPAQGGEGLTSAQVQTLTLEFLLFAVRHRPDLRRAIARRHRAFEAQLAEVVARWLALEGRQAALAPAELAMVQSWVTEGLGLRLLQDPSLVTAEHAADLLQAIMLGLAPREGP